MVPPKHKIVEPRVPSIHVKERKQRRANEIFPLLEERRKLCPTLCLLTLSISFGESPFDPLRYLVSLSLH